MHALANVQPAPRRATRDTRRTRGARKVPDSDAHSRAIGRVSDRLTELKVDTAEQMDRLGDRLEQHLDRIEARFTERLGRLDDSTAREFAAARADIKAIDERLIAVENATRAGTVAAVGAANLAREEAQQLARANLVVAQGVATEAASAVAATSVKTAKLTAKEVWDNWRPKLVIVLTGMGAAIMAASEAWKALKGG